MEKEIELKAGDYEFKIYITESDIKSLLRNGELTWRSANITLILLRKEVDK